MGLPDTVVQRVEHLELRRKVDKLESVEMEHRLCHLWLDAADIPRNLGLVQRLAVFCSLWIDEENYNIMRHNIDAIIKDPTEGNQYLAPLNKKATE